MKNIKEIADKLWPLFSHLPIDVIYLYGSVAEGKDDRFSDFDFGVLFQKNLSEKKRFQLQLQLFGKIAKILKIPEEKIDVVDLKNASVILQFNIICGKKIFCSNEQRRVDFETYVMARYHDEHYYLDRYLLEVIQKIRRGDYFEHQIPYAGAKT